MQRLTKQSAFQQILHVKMQDTHFGFALAAIDRVILLPLLEIMPDSPFYLAGLLNLAGKTIPVFDLGLCLNLPRKKNYSLETNVLICSQNQQTLGVIVDEVVGIEMIDGETLQMEEVFNDKESLLQATTTINTKVTLLINMKELFSMNVINKEINK